MRSSIGHRFPFSSAPALLLAIAIPALAASPGSKSVERKSAAPKAAPKKIATVEGLTEYDFPNGLRAAVLTRTRSAS